MSSMATTSNLELTAPSSSSAPPVTWDVFLSFYGEDTRKNFTSHLYSALDEAGILTFRDDPALEKGQEISSGIHNAIRDSKMFIIVISENYARSSWCLNELVEILSCKKTENQVVPVFYYVDPTNVRRQTGSFGDALDYHEKLYSPDMINKWKSALAQIGEVSGYHLKKHANEYESKIIQNIVEKVGRQVTTSALHLGEELFGIDSAVEEIYQKLRMESNDIRAIGICGMGGIGKTTTAKAFYNKYHTNFDSCCFIHNVKQYSQGGSPLLPLLEQLVKRILRFKKALVVLDDLDKSSCSEFLARHHNLFSAGSRIVITTRDIHLINQLKIDLIDVDIYMVKKLGQVESLELLNHHAFGKVRPPISLRELSVGFVTYAGGLPLALKVLGSSLRGRTQDEAFWKAKLEKVKKIPENEILEILQLSYNELDDDTVKSIFLDIAFFFVGKYKNEGVDIFKSCGYHPKVGIKILLERCLIMIDDNNMFQMHDLIQDMGREISKSTRLFLRGNEWEFLQNQEHFTSLKMINVEYSLNLKTTPNFGNSKSIERLYFRGCESLLRVHPSIRELTGLYVLDMTECIPVKNLAESLGQLNKLGYLCLGYCSNLKQLPKQLGDMKLLKVLDASCTTIEDLPDSVTQLRHWCDGSVGGDIVVIVWWSCRGSSGVASLTFTMIVVVHACNQVIFVMNLMVRVMNGTGG
ncbi:disease resistance protein Roq1-like [Apium graveolens]|uniref:disease resistance protein Roq1-like n=1 Tax=Apium graveolens TaxID=4045 RepID=UPI003D7BB29C